MASISETPKGRGRPKKTETIRGIAKRKLEFVNADTDMSVNSASQKISVAQSDLQLPRTDINTMTENIDTHTGWPLVLICTDMYFLY